MSNSSKITIIGAGAVGTSLASAFKSKGAKFCQIISRTISSASILSNKLGGVDFATNVSDFDATVGTAFITVADTQISEVVNELIPSANPDCLYIHCAGSVSIEVLRPLGGNIGVMYPLQTFNRSRILDLQYVPLFLEASPTSKEKLLSLAQMVSDIIYWVNGSEREKVHLAGVFASNFVNQLVKNAAEFVPDQPGLDYSILLPLLHEVVNKLHVLPPAEAQTGPAQRNDQAVIERHRELLKQENADLLAVYDALTAEIRKNI